MLYTNRSVLLPSSVSQDASLYPLPTIVETSLQNIHRNVFLFRFRISDVFGGKSLGGTEHRVERPNQTVRVSVLSDEKRHLVGSSILAAFPL